MQKADWYFDFISPFAYLQFQQLKDLSSDLAIRYRPVLLAGLLNHWENKGPAEVSVKRDFTYRFVVWRALAAGIPFRFPPRHPFNSLYALRLALVFDSQPRVIEKIFQAIWCEGRDLQDPPVFGELCAELEAEFGVAGVGTKLSTPEIKQSLKANGQAAIEAGVFGVPTFVMDGHIFWGMDATGMFKSYLENPGLFQSPEMKRLEQIQVGASRI